MLQTEAYLTNVNYDLKTFIVQACSKFQLYYKILNYPTENFQRQTLQLILPRLK
jgi:hypothetical protein